jgi:hypothetical protein
MRPTLAVTVLLAAVACGRSDPTPEATQKPTAADRGNYQDLPDLDALEVEIPPEVGAKPMELIPGFQNADKTFAFAVKAVWGDDATDAASLKASLQNLTISEWYDEVKLDDGWYVTFSMPRTEMVMPAKDGDPVTSKVVGSEYALHMVRTIAGQRYKCTCILPAREGLPAVITACKSLRAKGGATAPPARATPPVPAPAAAPAMTPAAFLAEPPTWEIQMLPRGLWIGEGGGPLAHTCRVELAMMVARLGKIREAAKQDPAALTCATKAASAVCTFAPAAEKSIPDTPTTWVFVADDDRPTQAVMAAVVLGGTSPPADLPAKTPCPRPSQDP